MTKKELEKLRLDSIAGVGITVVFAILAAAFFVGTMVLAVKPSSVFAVVYVGFFGSIVFTAACYLFVCARNERDEYKKSLEEFHKK